jgi:hypothetical protein
MNKHTSKNKRTQILLLVVLAFGMGFFNAACSKSKDNNNVASTPNSVTPFHGGFVVGNCSGCPSKPTLLSTAVGTDIANYNNGIRLQLALRLFGDGRNIGNNYYQGPVAADGFMYVGMQNGAYCPLPIGRYTVRTLQPGFTYGYQIYYGMRLEAINQSTHVRAELVLGDSGGVNTLNKVPAIYDIDHRAHNFALQKSVFVMSVGGRPCDQYTGWFELE